MPFDFNESAESESRKALRAKAEKPSTTGERIYADHINGELYKLIDHDNSDDARAIEREIIATEKTVEPGTAGWNAFLEKYGLTRAANLPDWMRSSNWPLARQDAARRIADSRGLPIYNEAAAAYRRKMKQSERYIHE